ncbi:tyrosine recombinase XerC [bacterium]
MKTKHKKLLESYLDYLNVERNFSQNTVVSYKNDLGQFLSFLAENKISLQKLDRKSGRAYLAGLKSHDYKKSSIERKIAVMKSFYKFLIAENIVKKTNFLYLRAPKKDKRIPSFLTQDEMDALLDAPDDGTLFGLRDRTVFEVFYSTGIRISELTNMRYNDIDFFGETISIRGKGNKERIVPIGRNSLSVVKKYCDERNKKFKLNNRSFIFINRKGEHINVRSIRRIVEKYIKKVSIIKKISPHTLRHTFATHLLNAGCDLKSVQDMLGHESLTTTQNYTHVQIEKLKKDYIKAHPHSKGTKHYGY